jgi:RNA polymerase sigma-70 factor (ECF subfamily)
MADFSHGSDDRLLAAAAEDALAFTAFYGRYEPAMLAYFLRRVGDPELAADLIAEVFAAALVGCRRYRPGKAHAQAWLFGIAQHKLANSRRRGRVADRARRHLGMAPMALEDDDLERIERIAGGGDIAMLALGGLPPEPREAVRGGSKLGSRARALCGLALLPISRHNSFGSPCRRDARLPQNSSGAVGGDGSRRMAWDWKCPTSLTQVVRVSGCPPLSHTTT